MTASQLPGPATTAHGDPKAGPGLARHTVGLAGSLFQSITFMAPGAAVATSLAVGALYAGGACPCRAADHVAALVIAASIGQLARHLPSAGSIYTYPAQGLHPVVGFLVGWGYALITGLVGPIVNLLIGYFVATILNSEFGWDFQAMWLVFMLVPAALTALLGYYGVKLGTRFGIALGAFEILVFVVLSVCMLANAARGGLTLDVFTLKYATAKGFTGAPGLLGRLGLCIPGLHRVRGGGAPGRGGPMTPGGPCPGRSCFPA